MMTVKQVSSLTGVSVRTLQFYDEIGLFKPTKITDAGYRLYDEAALEKLQQILFFKELDFKLKEIKTILEDPGFDKMAAYKKQRELIQMKRDRCDALLGLLHKLIQGESCMEFKEFDLSAYFEALNEFKRDHLDAIAKRYGSVEEFDKLVEEMEQNEEEIAKMAVQQYGSVENYTQAMKKSISAFLEHGPNISPSEVDGILQEQDRIMKELTGDLQRDPGSQEVQRLVGKMVAFVNESNQGTDMGENYWPLMAQMYQENPAFITGTDKKYGTGAAKFIGLALTAYLERQ